MRMRSGRGSEVGISSLSKKALIPGRREQKDASDNSRFRCVGKQTLFRDFLLGEK